ncbi:MAG: autotransporter outer membrane beta-barrel domain-containing protein, partial [Brevundimonas sp.]
DIQNGAVVGDLYFGAGQDRLSIAGGAVVTGVINDSDGRLDIDVTKGTLYAQQTSRATISSLDVGAEGTLLFLIDPQSNQTPGFNVTGQANLANGAGLGIGFSSLIDGPERYSLIHAGDLNVGSLNQTKVDENSPYLFVTTVGVDQAAGDLYVDVRQRTTQEMGLIKSETQAFDAIYGALGDNEQLRLAFLAQNGREGFINLYEQMLPDHSGGPLLSLASGVDAVTRALTGRNASAAPGQTSAWVQEINFYADKDKTDTYGFRSEGFGVAGGVERGTGLGAFGVSAAFTSSDLKDPEAEAEEVLSANLLELGLYWRAQGQYWTTWARAAGGYATFSATRQFVGEGINLSNKSEWHGFTLAAAGGASYERSFGRLWIRPEAYSEYFYLTEDARTEDGGGDGFDLSIDERTGHMFSATAAMNVGYSFGRDGWIRPELRLGWRQNIS